MKSTLSIALLLGLGSACSLGCAGTPKYLVEDWPLYADLDEIRVNPAGALDQNLTVQAGFKVCPPEEGLSEILPQAHRIEARAHIALQQHDP